MKTIAITGICKNAGKTTVLNYLLSKSIKVNAITSIGLDGETLDNVFDTSKPRIYVREGTYIISAKSSFAKSDITYEVVATTNINTSLGYLCVIRALSCGYVLVAGPNKVSEIDEIRNLISDFNIDTLYIDGAINRKQFCSLYSVDEVHTVIGACFSQDIEKTLDEVLLIKKLVSIPMSSVDYDSSYTMIIDGICYSDAIIDLDLLKSVVKNTSKNIYINSALNASMLKYLIMLGQDINLVVENTNKLFVSLKDLLLLDKSKINLTVAKKIRLSSIYVNPVGRGYVYDLDDFKQRVSSIFEMQAIDVGGAYSEL